MESTLLLVFTSLSVQHIYIYIYMFTPIYNHSLDSVHVFPLLIEGYCHRLLSEFYPNGADFRMTLI